MKIKNKFKDLKEIFYDFDGVFTNNKFYLNNFNEEFYIFNKSDSLIVSYIKDLKIKQSIITSERSNVVKLRAKKMGINLIVSKNKLFEIKKIIKNSEQLSTKNIAYIGNDLNDLDVIKYLTHTFCPKDSDKNVIKFSKHVLSKKGGEGVLKDFFEKIISL